MDKFLKENVATITGTSTTTRGSDRLPLKRQPMRFSVAPRWKNNYGRVKNKVVILSLKHIKNVLVHSAANEFVFTRKQTTQLSYIFLMVNIKQNIVFLSYKEYKSFNFVENFS